jgi:O-antigen ligase
MRYVGILLFLASIPIVIGLIRSSARNRRWCWFVLGAAPYIYGWAHLNVALVSWAYWPGYVKGMLVGLPDVLAIGLLATTRKLEKRHVISATLAFYVACASVSLLFSEQFLASFFWSWQLARVLLVCVAVGRVSAYDDAPRYIVSGMSIGMMLQAGYSVSQRAHGVIQASGTVGHQNLLGMMMHFGVLLSIGLVLGGDKRALLKWGIASGLLAIVLTGSRGTLGFAAFGAVALLLASLIRRPTKRKWSIVGAGVAALLVASPIAYLTLKERFTSAPLGDYDERAAFEKAAKAMWHDHPFGVGANEYVIVANTKGYSDRAGVAAIYGSRSANVHNAYLLIAAETGFLGLIGLVAIFGVGIFQALRLGWARPTFRYSELSLGAAFTLIVVAVHNGYEWIFVSEAVQYLFGITLGLITGLTSQRVLSQRATAAARAAARNAPSTEQIPAFSPNMPFLTAASAEH